LLTHVQPGLSPNVTVTSHAHPTSGADLDPGDEGCQQLLSLISKVTLDIVVWGLAGEDLSSPCAPLFPVVRRPAATGAAVQNLEVISCWKNLSSSQASEICVWEQLFKECLALQIKRYLQREFGKWLTEYPGK
jgi:hypothetical protein